MDKPMDKLNILISLMKSGAITTEEARLFFAKDYTISQVIALIDLKSTSLGKELF